MELLLVAVGLHVGLVESCKDIPVHKAHVIALDIIAVVGKLVTASLLSDEVFTSGAIGKASRAIDPHAFQELEHIVAGGAHGEKNSEAFMKQMQLLQRRLSRYTELRNTLRMAGTKDFGADIQDLLNNAPMYARALSPPEGTTADPAEARRALTLGVLLSQMAQVAHFENIPPDAADADPEDWRSSAEAMLAGLQTGKPVPVIVLYESLRSAWEDQDPARFNVAVQDVSDALTAQTDAWGKVQREFRFNVAQPFLAAMAIYVVAFLLAMIGRFGKPLLFSRTAFSLLVVGLLVQTIGIGWRMWLQGYAPVTNLYSSAVVVGWAAVVMSAVLEWNYRNGFGSICGSIVGFGALIVAHHLSRGGDTMEMLRAVLDSNLWLTAHVMTMILGYSGMFLGGLLAVCFLVRRMLVKNDGDEFSQSLGRMIYGVLCFALLFGYLGTVLGGIWADQSWGRFWGWDPKENGALLVVTWVAIVLHARAAGMIKGRGLAILAVFGNIITAFAWFGVNMLGVGLHAYGFMDGGLKWLLLFAAANVVVMGLALVRREDRKEELTEK